ncbi:MAG: hypothetical protein ABI273_18805 [Lacunisphaera sp.]
MSSTIPLRIDSALVHRARSAGALFDRSPTAQIEHWAKLGRVLDSVLSGKSVGKVKELARVSALDEVVTLSQTDAGQKKHSPSSPAIEVPSMRWMPKIQSW